MEEKFGVLNSPIGEIYIVYNAKGIIKVELFKSSWEDYQNKHKRLIRDESSSIFIKTTGQFEEYFQGKRTSFELPICIEGTEFQKEVWTALLEIPFGETRCYQDIAIRIGRPKAVRAIGQANRVNSFPIIIPCHRVIGKNGSMVGYAGSNIDVKVKLLQLEKTKVENEASKIKI